MSYQAIIRSLSDAVAIPGGLRQGKQIIIKGQVSDGAEQFVINLQSYGDESSDIALHFNPRFENQVVVRNSRSGDWGEEEVDQPWFPFSSGSDFSVRIVATHDKFRIYANGYHFVDFNHRHPLEEVRYLMFSGDVRISDTSFQDELLMPYYGEIPGRMATGKGVQIRGVVRDGANSFDINLQSDDGEAIYLHFNPRIYNEEVVRNSRLDGSWGEEELDKPSFPFQQGEFFDIFIIAAEEGFDIFVNDEYFVRFYYRLNVEPSHITVNGDIDVAEIAFLEPMLDSYKEIASGVQDGDTIIVTGYFKPEGQRIAVNFQYNDNDDSGIALHFNPRRDMGNVVLNSRFGGDWGDEDVHDFPEMFQSRGLFHIRFVIKKKKIKVFVDGRSFCSFKHRDDVLGLVRYIHVDGDAYVYQPQVLRKVHLPRVDQIPVDFNDNHWVSAKGVAKKHAQNIVVNLQAGPEDGSDLPFHFSARFAEQCVVRNSLSDGNWQEEEVDAPEFPFHPEEIFEILINSQNGEYKTYVNGRRFARFGHRLPADSARNLRLEGDAVFYEAEYI